MQHRCNGTKHFDWDSMKSDELLCIAMAFIFFVFNNSANFFTIKYLLTITSVLILYVQL